MTANPPYAPKTASKGVVLVTLAVAVVLPLALFGGVLVLSPIAKPEMMAAFVREVLGHDPATWPYTTLLYVASVAVLALVLLTFGAVVSGSTVWWEMRVSSRMQSRIGYNRVGAGGFFQWIADAVKLLLKEDLIPADADRVLFRAAPYFVSSRPT
jgi:NADH-quinone oxidoreductase subunit H